MIPGGKEYANLWIPVRTWWWRRDAPSLAHSSTVAAWTSFPTRRFVTLWRGSFASASSRFRQARQPADHSCQRYLLLVSLACPLRTWLSRPRCRCRPSPTRTPRLRLILRGRRTLTCGLGSYCCCNGCCTGLTSQEGRTTAPRRPASYRTGEA